MRRSLVTLALTFSLIAASSGMAEAQPEPEPDSSRLRWNEDEWGRFGTQELALTAFGFFGGIGMQLFLIPEISQSAGGILIDEAVRDILYQRSRGGRALAARISDILVNANLIWPYLIDTLLIAWGVDESRDVAGQMFWINALSYVITTSALTATKNLVARERPYHDECLQDLDYDHSCVRPDRFRSFFSGHAAYAFTGAGLMCIHHANLPLYGSAALDAAACITALAFAGTVATMRIVADKHYFSDVLVGALVGVFAGLVVPAIFHYGWDWSRSEGTNPDRRAP